MVQTWQGKYELEALRERRPPWRRQIITPILLTVKILSLGVERLTPKVLDHYLHHDLVMLQLVCFFCSFTHLRRSRSPPKFNQFFIVLSRTLPTPPPIKFHPSLFIIFGVMFPQIDRQTNIHATKNITSFGQGSKDRCSNDQCTMITWRYVSTGRAE